jgi:RNA-directed DNA polymerase
MGFTIIYADDFIITGTTKEILENKVKPAVQNFLAERGLQLSEEKTKVTHIQDGLDFLGFNIRKYKQKLLIKPSKQNVLEYLKKIREVIKKSRNTTSGELIGILNPKLIGWGNYYRHCVSKRTFNYIDNHLFHAIFRWCLRKHPNKSKTWIVKKCFSREGNNNWKFTGTKITAKGKTERLVLKSMSPIPIRRHKKIIGKATPYDPVYAEYFKKRKIENSRNTWTDMPITA